jgi:uncharacterized FAD-dependent dehydrogenase
VPAQRMIDFTQKRVPQIFLKRLTCGTTSVEMIFKFLTNILREGFTEFGKSMRGYLTNEAILHASRTHHRRIKIHKRMNIFK